MAFESPSGYSANVYPSSGDKSSLGLSQSSPDGETFVNPTKLTLQVAAAAPRASARKSTRKWDAESTSSSMTGDDPEKVAKWEAEVARLQAERSRLRAEAADDNLRAVVAEIEVEKQVAKRSRSGKSGESDGSKSARSTQSTKSTGVPAPSSSSGSALTEGNLRVHDRKSAKGKKLQKVEEDRPQADPAEVDDDRTVYHPEAPNDDCEESVPPSEVVRGRTATSEAERVPPPADLGSLHGVKTFAVPPSEPAPGPEGVSPPSASARRTTPSGTAYCAAAAGASHSSTSSKAWDGHNAGNG